MRSFEASAKFGFDSGCLGPMHRIEGVFKLIGQTVAKRLDMGARCSGHAGTSVVKTAASTTQ